MSTPPDKSPDRITPSKPLEPERPVPKPPTGFQSYMQETPTQQKAPFAPPTAGPTPMEVARGPAFQTGGPSYETLLAQAKTAQDTLGTVAEKLNTPNLKLKRSQTHLLKNKLNDANSYIRAAGAKLGVEGKPMKTASGGGPIERFFGYINDGQDQLVQAQTQLQELSAKGTQLRPTDMMMVQIKLSFAQQELEFSSTLLSKVIDSLKTIINVQL